MEKKFLEECKEVRDDFVKVAGTYGINNNLKLRTEIDNLLIMYDQLCERVREDERQNENSGLNTPVVSCSLPVMDLEQAEKEAMETSYAYFAVGEEINIGDAGAFYLEGYNKARKLLGNES